jgi:hypothetical protein
VGARRGLVVARGLAVAGQVRVTGGGRGGSVSGEGAWAG